MTSISAERIAAEAVLSFRTGHLSEINTQIGGSISAWNDLYASFERRRSESETLQKKVAAEALRNFILANQATQQVIDQELKDYLQRAEQQFG